MANYFINLGATLSCLANSLVGGEYGQTLSCRIGLSILDKGWAYKIPFPNILRDHFIIVAAQSRNEKS
ncbi:hypothetical protein [Mesorhizobium sp. M1B.F.Ca.ET.045.04.1.1]|uniref:hypothetical protein n=1 Tax=Mesorhizobium sp. M1B.F.Ca.ET.045.04.1.1 TaxID=2493673 RepID=UPI000F74E361|nr:hypothetical protein [Mesorhizobium sp. M1B.F.Ca.ET.045.04.1.1]AZO29421.1 hypothetical protein EJ071_19850 [Mesorhizobium sp. M1B.F.Ca.ET.045.04.1.1]